MQEYSLFKFISLNNLMEFILELSLIKFNSLINLF